MNIKRVFIDRSVADHPQTIGLSSQFSAPIEIVDAAEPAHRYVRAAQDPIGRGKQTLFITKNRGRFIRSCPGTRSYHCCGYQILHIGTYCTMDCAYCILQSYFNPPLLQYFVNTDQLNDELEEHLSGREIIRIGTGEFTDSLIWEPLTNYSHALIARFAKQNHAVLELKTKTTAIKALLPLTHNRKTILAWSLNTPKIISTQERHTAPLELRLKAATVAESKGYPLAFHFDPLVIYEGCEVEYEQVIKTLFSSVKTENITWISLGSFRFMPSLKTIVAQRFPDSKLIYGEFIPGLDNKMRYFKPLRIALYQRIVSAIHEYAPRVTIYFCMEDDEVWQKTLGFTPAEKGGLSQMLDDAATKTCHLERVVR